MNVKHTTVDGRKVEARVVEGTVRDNLRRAQIMRAELEQTREEQVEVMVIQNLLRINTFPSCVAATAELKDSDHPDLSINDLTFDMFLDLPDQFLTKWTAQVFEYNPGWSDDNVGPQVRPSRTKSSSTSG